jgi:periplasmic copper chaperone A
MRLLRILTLVAAAIFSATAVLAQTAPIAIEHAWARATPGKSDIGAAYLTIRSPTADRLVAASTPVANKVELHTMSMTGMVMKMRPLAAINIPADEPVTLAPGGMHIMLIGLKSPLKPGQSFPLTLTFARAGSRTVDVAVEPVGASKPAAGPMMQMH